LFKCFFTKQRRRGRVVVSCHVPNAPPRTSFATRAATWRIR